MSNIQSIQFLMDQLLAELSCQTGTIHRTCPEGQILSLIWQVGVPDILLGKISSIPFGKGIAGVAAERQEPVELCNLQENLGGIANLDAQKTGVSGSIAVPIFAYESNNVIGTLGIGKFEPHKFTTAEKERITASAAAIAMILSHKDFCSD